MGVNEAITWQAYFLLQEGGTLDPARPIQQTQQHTQQQLTSTTAGAGGAKPSTGTISGMLADFSKALGLYSARSKLCLVDQIPLISPAPSLQHN
jgi:hypothetical protein